MFNRYLSLIDLLSGTKLFNNFKKTNHLYEYVDSNFIISKISARSEKIFIKFELRPKYLFDFKSFNFKFDVKNILFI